MSYKLLLKICIFTSITAHILGSEILIDDTQTDATEQDIGLFETFWKQSFVHLPTALSKHHTYEKSKTVCIRAFDKTSGKLIGLALYSKMTFPESALCLNNLCIDHSYQRKGIGTRLIAAVIDLHKPPKVNLIAENLAVPFYQKLGFTAPKGVGKISTFMEKISHLQIKTQTSLHHKFIKTLLRSYFQDDILIKTLK